MSFPDALKMLTSDVIRPMALAEELDADEFIVSPVDEVRSRIEAGARWRGLEAVDFVVDTSLSTYVAELEEIFRPVSSIGWVTRSALRSLIEARVSRYAPATDELPTNDNNAVRLGQLTLRMGGGFSPSAKLTDIWQSSLMMLAAEANRSVAKGSEFEGPQEFAKILHATLGTAAQYLRYEPGSSVEITKGRRFLASYQIQVCDAFLIVPDQAAEFLALLQNELSAAIEAGYSISGDWGEVALDKAGDLFFRLNAAKFIGQPEFQESEEIE